MYGVEDAIRQLPLPDTVPEVHDLLEWSSPWNILASVPVLAEQIKKLTDQHPVLSEVRAAGPANLL